MIFRRNRNEPPPPQYPGNKFVNRLLTYTLILFVIYVAASNNHQTKISDTKLDTSELNYTPINWANFVKITNLVNGHQTSFNFVDNKSLTLNLRPDDLAKLKEENRTDEISPVYKLEFDDNAEFNSVYNSVRN